MKKNIILAVSLLGICVAASAQKITVKDTTFTTYGFSDPNPIPLIGNIYPYHKFESFALEPEQQEWKMVVLENKWLRIKILPEIGGKIWSVYDKVRGKELFYDNKVVKFREISLRGPWTSGGIEFNYGIIGHAPSCAHPVDWSTEYKSDGSVSCYIGVLELLTRTTWTVEINLPADAVWLRTRSFWHNSSGEFQPYYTWANSGVDASDDLEILYPGTYTIGHDGQTTPFPIDECGRDLSKYSEQAFGLDKSFHPGGSHKGYFGAYWRNADFGMLHYALRDEKLGRKYFSWTQSPQGEIWKGILTDDNPQYVELQSGRLFNQNLLNSVETPFKQTVFTPYGTDEWNEYWMPFAGTGGVSEVDLNVVVNVGESGIAIFPLRHIKGEMKILDAKGSEISSLSVDLRASEPFRCVIPAGTRAGQIILNGRRIWSAEKDEISRPHTINTDFSLESPQGLVAYAEYLYGMRYFREAGEKVNQALVSEPSLASALRLKAQLQLRSAEYEQAFETTDKLLAIDEYDAKANYIRGMAALNLGRKYDAMDAFEIAAITSELRSASQLQLARIHFADGNPELAAEYAKKSLVGNSHCTTACAILHLCDANGGWLERISDLDPLCPFPAIERMLSGRITATELAETVKQEQRGQVYLEWVVFYNSLGLNDKALALAEACPDGNALIGIWASYLRKDNEGISHAENLSLDFVFPFRRETLKPLTWAVSNGGGWKSSYLLSMLNAFLGHYDRALALIAGYAPDYAPFYAYRSSLNNSESDLRTAVRLDPEQWRYRYNLSQVLYRNGRFDEALELVSRYYSSHKNNFHIGELYVKLLIAKENYIKADKILSSMTILPFEGQTGSHILWRDIKLHLAAGAIDRGDYKTALARIDESLQWPESLGVGKPYDELLNTDLEKVLTAIVYARKGDRKAAEVQMNLLKKRDASLDEFYRKATIREDGKYIKISSLLGNLDASLDKKLF